MRSSYVTRSTSGSLGRRFGRLYGMDRPALKTQTSCAGARGIVPA